MIAASELRERPETSWQELEEQVVRVAAALNEMGVGRGDRVVAYMPNVPESSWPSSMQEPGRDVVELLADFGVRSVIDRFSQIEPNVLLGVDGYRLKCTFKLMA